jgi:hypothetical protein
MKKAFLTIITLTLLTGAFAAPKKYRLNNSTSNWAVASNWSPVGLPQDGDTILIPTSTQLQLSNDFSFTDVYLDVYGSIVLSGNSMKMALAGNSTVNVHTGAWISGDKASQQIVLSSIVFKGDNPVLTGPKIATASSTSFAPYQEFSILPVKFLSFTVDRKNNQFLIQWTTAEEINAAYFEVQRSTDGANWTAIATVKAAGNSTNTYSYTDKNCNAASVYYRVKEVDNDHQSMYTAVRFLKNNQTATPSIITVQNKIAVVFPQQAKGAVTVEVISLNGYVVAKQVLHTPAGMVTLAPGGLKGILIVRVSNSQEVQTARQVIL